MSEPPSMLWGGAVVKAQPPESVEGTPASKSMVPASPPIGTAVGPVDAGLTVSVIAVAVEELKFTSPLYVAVIA
jgi:hypothetical protein